MKITCRGSFVAEQNRLSAWSLFPKKAYPLLCNAVDDAAFNWASPGENPSSGFPTKLVSNQSPQLQRLARKLKFQLYQVYI